MHLVLALALALPASAQTSPPPSPLGLAQALELARAHSPLLPVAAGRVRLAAGTARERTVAPNPVLELRREGVGGPVLVDHFATLTLPLDVTFQRAALRSAGRGQVAAAVADSAAIAREVEVAVATLYWRSSLADALAAAAADEQAAMEEIARWEEAQLGEGMVAEGVVLRARLEVERARLARARSDAEAQRAHAALAQAVGLPAESLGRAVDAAPLAVPVLPAPATALARALAARPEVEAAMRRVEAARWNVTAGWRAALPGVGLQLGAKGVGDRTGGVLALSVEVPLRNAGQATRERARGELTLAEAELDATRRRVEAEVDATLATYARLVEARPAGSIDLAARGAEVAGIAAAAYREGAIPLVELLEVQRARSAARTTAAAWTAEVALALVEVQRALGAPIGEGR